LQKSKSKSKKKYSAKKKFNLENQIMLSQQAEKNLKDKKMYELLRV